MAGLLSNILGEEDELQARKVNLDPQTDQLINQSAQGSMQNSGQLHAQAMEGTQDAMSFLPQEGMGNVAMSGALTNKYRQLAQNDIDKLSLQQKYLSGQRKAQRLRQSAQQAQARQQVTNDNYRRVVDAYNANMAARAQVISSVLGLAGTVGGAVVGGPAGAVVGSQAGAAVAPQPKPAQQTPSYLGGNEMGQQMGRSNYMRDY